MSKIAIVGCGVIGAAIAYELSQISGLEITVFDKQAPGQGATGAALGILVGIVSQKIKGRNWQLRQNSVQRYETLIPELENLTGLKIPFNRQGIIMLCLAEEDLPKWQNLAKIRAAAGWNLEIWDVAQLQSRCPQLNCEKVIAAIYSPQDRQLDPVALTQALVAGATQNGVNFQFGVNVIGTDFTNISDSMRFCQGIQTSIGKIDVDWLVISAGLGSFDLTKDLQQPIDIQPVLGQALHLKLEQPMGFPDFQPVITGDDVHVAPLGGGEYWVGATVEFPQNGGEIVANGDYLEAVKQQAIAFFPALANAEILKTWSGLRPRPEGRPAPVIGNLPGFNNVLLATGHYRNGILLAPATAQAIRQAIVPI